MKALLICDDYWHPGQTPIDGVEPLKQRGFEFDIIKNANDFTVDMLQKYPAVLMCKSDEISQTDKQPWKTDAVQKAFVNYIENGGGLIAVHSALVNSKNYKNAHPSADSNHEGKLTAGIEGSPLDNMIGCRFLGHPNNCPVTVQSVKPHPVTEGVSQFTEIDEHYRIEITSPDADVIAASYSPPQGDKSKYQDDPYHNTPASICPAVYVRSQGKGRVCVLTSGHLLPVWLSPQFQRMLINALNWCGAVYR